MGNLLWPTQSPCSWILALMSWYFHPRGASRSTRDVETLNHGVHYRDVLDTLKTTVYTLIIQPRANFVLGCKFSLSRDALLISLEKLTLFFCHWSTQCFWTYSQTMSRSFAQLQCVKRSKQRYKLMWFLYGLCFFCLQCIERISEVIQTSFV